MTITTEFEPCVALFSHFLDYIGTRLEFRECQIEAIVDRLNLWTIKDRLSRSLRCLAD
jgi:hypothetical protein